MINTERHNCKIMKGVEKMAREAIFSHFSFCQNLVERWGHPMTMIGRRLDSRQTKEHTLYSCLIRDGIRQIPITAEQKNGRRWLSSCSVSVLPIHTCLAIVRNKMLYRVDLWPDPAELF